MTEIIRLEREQRLEKLLGKFKYEGVSRGVPEGHIKKLINLYLTYLRVTNVNWPNFSEEEFVTYNRNATSNLIKFIASDPLYRNSDEEFVTFNSNAKPNLIGFISLDPFISPVKEAIAALISGNIKKALSILQKIVDEQDLILGEIQRKNRVGSKKESDYITLLKIIYKNNPTISRQKMLGELRKEVGKGVIRTIKKDTNQIITTKGEEYSISGLKDKIYSFRRDQI